MPDHRRIPTHAEIARLTSRVRDGRLDDEQREQLAQLLDTIGSAVRVAPTVAARYPGQPERAAGRRARLLGRRARRLRRAAGGLPAARPRRLWMRCPRGPARPESKARPTRERGACHGHPRAVPTTTDTGATAVAPAIHRESGRQ